MRGAPWYDGELAGHLAKDTGMTPEQFQQETGIRPLMSTDLARDTGITDEEFIAETGTDQEGGISLAASAPPPD
jgi:hypothetical protein